MEKARDKSHAYRSAILLFFVLCITVGCRKKEVGPQCPSCEERVSLSNQAVLIGCEGNFGWGNGSLSLYNPSTKTVTNQVFQNQNGYPLGDIVQSITEHSEKLYVVANNSGKIEILDMINYQSLGTISGFTSPRYFLGIGTEMAYVSDLYSGEISIVDLSSKTIIGTIPTNHWTEHMAVFNSEVYVCVPDTNWVIKINPSTHQIVDTIFLEKSPIGMVQDANGIVWILCNGGINEGQPTLTQYAPSNNMVLQVFTFSSSAFSPSALTMNATKTKLYFLNDGVYEMEINATELPSQPIIPQSNHLYYGMDISPISGDIYVTDAIDYVQAGRVYRYDSTATLLDDFSVGIIPQSIWFNSK